MDGAPAFEPAVPLGIPRRAGGVGPVGLVATLALQICLACPCQAVAQGPAVEQWGIFEIALDGPRSGNPFTEVQLSAAFVRGVEKREVAAHHRKVAPELIVRDSTRSVA